MAFTLAVIFYRFLFLLLVLESVIALPWLSTRRDTTWGASPGQAFIDFGAAGFGALNQLWNQFTTQPSTETNNYLPDPDPNQPPPLLPEAPNTSGPEWLTPPLFDPNPMKKCSAYTQPIGNLDNQLLDEGGTGIASLNELNLMIPEKEYEGVYVQQSTKTGRPLMETCDVPNGNAEDAYLVQEINFVEAGKAWQEWPSAILVSDIVKQYDIRYDLERKQGGKMVVRKVANFKFMRKMGKINAVLVELGSSRRHGWLVGAGEPKEAAALIWFEGVLNSVGYVGRSSTVPQGRHAPHFTSVWVKRVFAKLLTETSPHWVPLIAG